MGFVPVQFIGMGDLHDFTIHTGMQKAFSPDLLE